jgi:uncharacterized damage-inducible protein DinB
MARAPGPGPGAAEENPSAEGAMTRDLLVALYDYGEWAAERLLARAAALTDEERRRRPSRGAESIHATFVHLVSADRRWFARWTGAPVPPMLGPDALPTLEAVRAEWQALGGPRRAYLAGLTPAALAEEIRWTGLDGQPQALARWQGIVQCANHGTQHRAELALMLSDLGQSPGDLDFSLYCRPRR